jgi:hypothetical protein
MATTTTKDSGRVIAQRTPVKTHGSLAGVTGAPANTGDLPEPYASAYTNRRAYITYTAYSYVTPIAWHDSERGWVVPSVRYSVTTSKHQGHIRRALESYTETV